MGIKNKDSLPVARDDSTTTTIGPAETSEVLKSHAAAKAATAVPETDAAYEEVIRQAVAPHEAFWRRYAKLEAQPALIEARKPSAQNLLKKSLAGVIDGNWLTLDDCIPPGSLLDVVDKYFIEKSDFARELPFFLVMHYVAAYLMQQGAEIKLSEKQSIYPDFWTVVVAPSGGGKSTSQAAIAEAIGLPVVKFPDSTSTLKFLDNLAANNHGLYVKDEFGKFLKAISTSKALAGMPAYLLELYDNKTLTYSTMSTQVSIERAALSILGTSQIATLPLHLTPEMMIDGFAQRVGFIYAEKDKDRRRVAFYNFDDLEQLTLPFRNNLLGMKLHAKYRIDGIGSDVYQSIFDILADRAEDSGIDDSFHRRISWRTFKYALVYHVLTGKTDDVLHTEDLIYGANLASFSLRDFIKVKKLIDTAHGAKSKNPGVVVTIRSEAEEKEDADSKKLSKVTSHLAKIRDGGGAAISISGLQAGVRAVKGDADEARKFATLAVSNDPTLAPYIKLGSSLK